MAGRPDDPEELLTLDDMASILRMPVRAVLRLATIGKLQGVRIGRKWRFTRKNLDDLVAGQSSGAGRKILLVDDEVDILKVTSALLRRHGYEVICCESGKLALDVLEQEPRPALMLLDLMLPDIEGPEVLRLMRERRIDVPVLIVTANADSPMMDRALEHGVFSVVKKPFKSDELVAAVNRLTGTSPPAASTKAQPRGAGPRDDSSTMATPHGSR